MQNMRQWIFLQRLQRRTEARIGPKLLHRLVSRNQFDASDIRALARAVLELLRFGKWHIRFQINRKVQRAYDADLYKERNIIERFFNKLKQFRRIATRYDKLLVNFMGFVKLAAIAIWLK